jgi:hypothetical protein
VITHKSFHVTLSDQRERRVSCSGNFILENGDSSVASLPHTVPASFGRMTFWEMWVITSLFVEI